MALFLLLHGSQHGAWCWDKVRAELEGRGHRTLAFDLPGHGKDATPRRDLCIDNYRQAVIDYVKRNDLQDIILVGHSLAGIFLTAAAPALTDRVTRLVFVAAMVLEPGESALDYAPPERRARYRELADASPDYSFKAPYRLAREFYLEELSAEEARAAYAKLTPQPFGVWCEPVKDYGFSSIDTPRRYVLCRGDKVFSQEVYQKFASRLGVLPIAIEAGHDAMLSKPTALAEALEG